MQFSSLQISGRNSIAQWSAPPLPATQCPTQNSHPVDTSSKASEPSQCNRCWVADRYVASLLTHRGAHIFFVILRPLSIFASTTDLRRSPESSPYPRSRTSPNRYVVRKDGTERRRQRRRCAFVKIPHCFVLHSKSCLLFHLLSDVAAAFTAVVLWRP